MPVPKSQAATPSGPTDSDRLCLLVYNFYERRVSQGLFYFNFKANITSAELL